MSFEELDQVPKIRAENYENAVQFELEIQTQRILYILQNLIKRLEILKFLPVLLENNGELLDDFFSDQEIQFIWTAVKRYWTSSERSSFDTTITTLSIQSSNPERVINIATQEMDQRTQHLMDKRLDPNINELLTMLDSNKKLQRWLKTCELEASSELNTLVNTCRDLRQIITDRFNVSSAQEMENEKNLKAAYKQNYVLRSAIKRAEKKLTSLKQDLNEEVEKKRNILEYYLNMLDQLHEDFNERIRKEVQDSEKKMMEESIESERYQIELCEKAHICEESLKKDLKNHIADENILKSKRLKVEAQLASWLNKYDSDVGDKHAELESLQKEFDDQRAEFNHLTEIFEDQNKIYIDLMIEKEAEEQRIFEEMAFEFLKRRAVRRIMRWWSGVLQRRAERKAKKGKKGKGAKAKGAKKPKKPKAEKKADKKPKKATSNEETVEGEEGKKKKGKKGKAKKTDVTRKDDPNKFLDGDLMEELHDPNAFDKSSVHLDF